MAKYGYKILDYDEDIIDYIDGWEDDDGRWIAAAAAENFHSFHDGWESHWPKTFVIVREDGSELGTYTVEREAVPSFYAYEENK